MGKVAFVFINWTIIQNRPCEQLKNEEFYTQELYKVSSYKMWIENPDI